jgi:hypothetical protein
VVVIDPGDRASYPNHYPIGNSPTSTQCSTHFILRLYVSTPKKWPARIEVTYGLYERCETDWLSLGGGGGYVSHTCTRFPSRKECEEGNGQFCLLWYSAGYVSQLGSAFAVGGLVAILGAALSRARRRKLWEVVATLIGLRGKHLPSS